MYNYVYTYIYIYIHYNIYIYALLEWIMQSLRSGCCGLFRPRQIREIAPRLQSGEAGTLIPCDSRKDGRHTWKGLERY